MALFGNKEEKEIKQLEKDKLKAEKIMTKYNLDDIDERDRDNLIALSYELAGNGWLEWGSILGGTNEKDELQRLNFSQQVIIEQNFLMIKQLDKLNKNLEKLTKQ